MGHCSWRYQKKMKVLAFLSVLAQAAYISKYRDYNSSPFIRQLRKLKIVQYENYTLRMYRYGEDKWRFSLQGSFRWRNLLCSFLYRRNRRNFDTNDFTTITERFSWRRRVYKGETSNPSQNDTTSLDARITTCFVQIWQKRSVLWRLGYKRSSNTEWEADEWATRETVFIKTEKLRHISKCRHDCLQVEAKQLLQNWASYEQSNRM